MAEFMRNGGVAMWVMLITAIGAGVAATWNGPDARPRILAAATVGVLAQAMLGMALGLVMVSRAAERAADAGHLVALGLGELANNGILGGGLALALGAAWLVATRRSA